METVRQEIKFNFLKNIIMRLDFQGVLPAELEKVIIKAKAILKEAGFNRFSERIDNAVNLKQNPSQMESPIQSLDSIKVFSFINEKDGYSIDLSTNFITLSVESDHYSPFEKYSEIFMKIVNVYRAEIDFFTTTRLGFRKINICLLSDITKINEYFAERYFSYNNSLSDTVPLAFSHSETFQIQPDQKVNFTCKVEHGKTPKGISYRIIIDSDDYLDNQDSIDALLTDPSGIGKMNDTLFTLYLSGLTDKLLNALKGKIPLPTEDIEGIEPNG